MVLFYTVPTRRNFKTRTGTGTTLAYLDRRLAGEQIISWYELLHHCNADPDSAFHFNADQDLAPHQRDANQQPLVSRPSRAPRHFKD